MIATIQLVLYVAIVTILFVSIFGGEEERQPPVVSIFVRIIVDAIECYSLAFSLGSPMLLNAIR